MIDAQLESWVESANDPETDFPIQNLPYGVFDPGDPRIGVAIGDRILDLSGCADRSLLDSLPAAVREACFEDSLNTLMALGKESWRALRGRLVELLASGSRRRQDVQALLVRREEAEMIVPVLIGDYTDFYASVDHATNVGALFRPDNPLLPNYKYVPIGYHGRASSIVISGSDVRRPSGQIKDPKADRPVFAPSRSLDYELEVGFFIGPGNALGEAIPIESAESRLFGLCLLNDWSARDIQAWEYQPLGPFLGKNFATSISAWIVTMEALEPFRARAFERPQGDPEPLQYLRNRDGYDRDAIDVTLEVYLSSTRMRAEDRSPQLLSRGFLRNLYWTPAQLVAHHASNGCNLRTGDLLASGTVSGPTKEERGCLLELTRRGAEPIPLAGGESRRFLEDGDEVILRGYCEREGVRRIGFGECRGKVTQLPART